MLMRRFKGVYTPREVGGAGVILFYDVDYVFDVLDMADSSKSVKIYEKLEDWVLVYHVVNDVAIVNKLCKFEDNQFVGDILTGDFMYGVGELKTQPPKKSVGVMKSLVNRLFKSRPSKKAVLTVIK